MINKNFTPSFSGLVENIYLFYEYSTYKIGLSEIMLFWLCSLYNNYYFLKYYNIKALYVPCKSNVYMPFWHVIVLCRINWIIFGVDLTCLMKRTFCTSHTRCRTCFQNLWFKASKCRRPIATYSYVDNLLVRVSASMHYYNLIFLFNLITCKQFMVVDLSTLG